MGLHVVTGAASGIGAATCARLEADGHEVLRVDRVAPGGDPQRAVVADLATATGRREALDAVRRVATDGLDGAVACAGLGPLPSRPAALLVSVNYFGAVGLLEGCRDLLRPGGAAVAVSSNSTSVQPGVPDALVEACLAGDEAAACAATEGVATLDGVYPATKTALARWVRRQAVTPGWVGRGVRLNAVAPGLVETALTAEARADATLAPLMAAFPVPLGRGGRAEEVAAVIAWLLGPESSLLVGTLLYADGGSDALLRPDSQPVPWRL